MKNRIWLLAFLGVSVNAQVEIEKVEGFELYSNPNDQTYWEVEDYKKGKEVIRHHIRVAVELLPEHAIVKMREAPITIHFDNIRCSQPGKLASYSRHWGHIQYRCFKSVANQGLYEGIFIHELAHAWHDRWVPEGFGNWIVKQHHYWATKCYQDEFTTYRWRNTGREYWRSSPEEYLAEMTRFYFDRGEGGGAPLERKNMHVADVKLVEAVWFKPRSLYDDYDMSLLPKSIEDCKSGFKSS